MSADSLETIRQMLQADGYDIAERPGTSGSRAFEVIALENACVDCLVPKDIMRGIIAQTLGIGTHQVDLTYPAGSHHEA
jgi:hypothetical protein